VRPHIRHGTRSIWWALGVLAVTATSCGPGSQRPAANPTRVAAAETAMQAYLERARFPSPTPVPDSLQACEAYGGGDPQLALAKFRVLDSRLSGDTAVVRAEIVSVATVKLAPDGPYEVSQRVGTDTLSWSLVRTARGDEWAICGYSREGVGFVRLQYLGPTARWLNGASLQSVTRSADSVERTR
jgi:hypothetical protein